MTPSTSKQTIATAALTALALTLGACGSVEETNRRIENSLFSHGNWEQLHQRYENRVERVTIEHTVSFPENRTSLTKAERRGLIEFLQRSRIGSVDEVTVIGSRPQDGNYDALTEARVEFVKIELGAFGIIGADAPEASSADQSKSHQVVIVVDRHVVVTPDCSGTQPIAGERPGYMSGCMDVANLGMMVADPRDLVQGRPIGPMDGEYAAKGIFDYRDAEEKETELEEIITSTTGDQI